MLPVTKNLSRNQAKRQNKLQESNRNNNNDIAAKRQIKGKTKWPCMANIEKKALICCYKVQKARTTFIGGFGTEGAN